MLERLLILSGFGKHLDPAGAAGKRCWVEGHLVYLAGLVATAT